MKKELITFKDPKSPISEVFRTLRTNIQFMNINKKLQTVLITSSLPGEGKSWVASNLAITFAQAGKRVIIVDADMRKGRQYSIFGVAPRPGLANCLSDKGEDVDINEIGKYIKNTGIEGLDIIPAGNVPPNPSELLITPQMANLLNRLMQVYEIVIVDAPPCELVTDAAILSRIVDSTVVVTAYKQTKKACLQRTIKSIKNVGGNIAGIVFNKIPIDTKKYEQSYYYGSQMVPVKKQKGKILSEKIENIKSKQKEGKRFQDKSTEEEHKGKTTEEILKEVNDYLEGK